MKPLFIKEILDKNIRENFQRIVDAVRDFDTDFSDFRVPRYTTVTRDAMTPRSGMIILNTTTSKFQGYSGSAWVDLN